jgi:hypothetical protein
MSVALTGEVDQPRRVGRKAHLCQKVETVADREVIEHPRASRT